MSDFSFAPPTSLLPAGYAHNAACDAPETILNAFEQFDREPRDANGGQNSQLNEGHSEDANADEVVEVSIDSPRTGSRGKKRSTAHAHADFDVEVQPELNQADSAFEVCEADEAHEAQNDNEAGLASFTTTQSLSHFNVRQLRDLCREHNLKVGGKRSDLVKRLTSAAKQE